MSLINWNKTSHFIVQTTSLGPGIRIQFPLVDLFSPKLTEGGLIVPLWTTRKGPLEPEIQPYLPENAIFRRYFRLKIPKKLPSPFSVKSRKYKGWDWGPPLLGVTQSGCVRRPGMPRDPNCSPCAYNGSTLYRVLYSITVS